MYSSCDLECKNYTQSTPEEHLLYIHTVKLHVYKQTRYSLSSNKC